MRNDIEGAIELLSKVNGHTDIKLMNNLKVSQIRSRQDYMNGQEYFISGFNIRVEGTELFMPDSLVHYFTKDLGLVNSLKREVYAKRFINHIIKNGKIPPKVIIWLIDGGATTYFT